MVNNLVVEGLNAMLWILQSWVWVGGVAWCGLAIGMFGLMPMDVTGIRDATTWDWVKSRIRRMSLLGLVVVVVPLPWLTNHLYCNVLDSVTQEGCLQMTDFRDSVYRQAGILMVLSGAGGFVLGMIWGRFFYTWISHITRRLRYRVAEDAMPDIRDLASRKRRTVAKDYDPRKYYDENRRSLFVGLSEKRKPVMLREKDFEGRHLEVIGPTGFGKGVLIGVIVDQLIRMNAREDCRNVVIAIMPKQDLWLPHIMEQACEAVGCEFTFFDMLSARRGGGWSPLSAGTPEERRTRLMIMLGMGETGSDADFYKLGEKQQIDSLMDREEHSCLQALRDSLVEEGKKKRKQGGAAAMRAIDTLNEFCRMDTFLAPEREAGLNIPQLLESEEPAALYVNSSLTHETVLKMTKGLITEITQQAMSLAAQGRRRTRVWLIVDELRFLISESFDKALATVGMYQMNIIAAYQSPTDLEKGADRGVNGRAIAHSVHTNMQLKLMYRIGEGDQARWAAEQTGTKWLSVTGRESAQVDGFGAEKWSQERSVQKMREYHVSENEFKALAKREGVLIAPERLAQVIHTAHVPVEPRTDFYAKDYVNCDPAWLNGDAGEVEAEDESPEAMPGSVDFEIEPVPEREMGDIELGMAEEFKRKKGVELSGGERDLESGNLPERDLKEGDSAKGKSEVEGSGEPLSEEGVDDNGAALEGKVGEKNGGGESKGSGKKLRPKPGAELFRKEEEKKPTAKELRRKMSGG